MLKRFPKWLSLGICTLLVVVLSSTIVQGQSADETFKRRTGNLCKRDTDCPDNAFCKQSDTSGYCDCKDDYIITLFNSTHRECVREASNLGDVCKMNLQCQTRLSINAICLDGACACKEGAHFDDGRCYETSLIGQSCQVTQNCYLGPDEAISNQAYCVKGICTCSLLHSPRDGGTRCLKDADLGDACEDDPHCTGLNTRCHGVCRCQDGFVAYERERRCLKEAISLGDSCEIESQCTSRLNSTTCIDQECMCTWGFHDVNGSCWTTRYNGQRCIRNQECIMEDTNLPGECVSGVCSCIGCRSTSSATRNAMDIFRRGFIPFVIAITMARSVIT